MFIEAPGVLAFDWGCHTLFGSDEGPPSLVAEPCMSSAVAEEKRGLSQGPVLCCRPSSQRGRSGGLQPRCFEPPLHTTELESV